MKMTVEYTIQDDGIHLACDSCGWARLIHLGFSPTVDEVIKAAEKHITEVHS